MSVRKTGKESQRSLTFSRIDKLHPVKTFLFFALLGSTLVFLSMVFLYSIRISSTDFSKSFQFPKIFFVSTVILLISSFSVSKSLQAFKDDASRSLQINLLITTFLAVLFFGCQILGWKELYEEGIFVYSKSSVTFLYVISAFHLLHVGAGFIGLIYLNFKASSINGDIVKALLYFSDKREKTKIELMNIFWHYINFLWLCLFFMFLFTI